MAAAPLSKHQAAAGHQLTLSTSYFFIASSQAAASNRTTCPILTQGSKWRGLAALMAHIPPAITRCRLSWPAAERRGAGVFFWRVE